MYCNSNGIPLIEQEQSDIARQCLLAIVTEPTGGITIPYFKVSQYYKILQWSDELLLCIVCRMLQPQAASLHGFAAPGEPSTAFLASTARFTCSEHKARLLTLKFDLFPCYYLLQSRSGYIAHRDVANCHLGYCNVVLLAD